MDQKPIQMQWDGEAFYPASPRWAKEADKQFVIGERYMMTEHHDRSMNSHRHFFACVNDGWQNLPDHMLDQYPTAGHLRKKMMIRAGYCQERSIVCPTKADAVRMAAFVAPMDTYCIVIPRETVVTVYTAESQAMKAMGKKRFQQSKEDVLNAIDDLLGVERGATERNEAA